MKSVSTMPQPTTQPINRPNGTPGASTIPLAPTPVGPFSFAEADADFQPPLVVSTYGTPGSGKSRMAGSMPGDIGALLFEHKAKLSILRAAQEHGRKVFVPRDETGAEMSFIRVDNPMLLSLMPDACFIFGQDKTKGMSAPQVQEKMQEIADSIRIDGPQPQCCKRHYYRWGVNRAKWALWKLAEMPNIRSIVIDTFGQLVQDISYANYGKDGVIDPKEFGFAPRQDMNQEIRDLLNSIVHKNLLLTHQSASVWKDGKPLPGKTKPSSQFSGLGHYCTVMIEQWRNDTQPVGNGRYGLSVMDCQQNAALIGRSDLMWDDSISFKQLALAVYGDETDLDYWE